MKNKERTKDKEKIAEILHRPYPIEIHQIPDEDGGGYHVFLPDFGHSACSAAGDTLEEALEILNEVKAVVVSHYVENGITIPEPSGDPAYAESLQQVPFRVPKSTHRRLKEIAKKEGLTLNSLLSTVITEFITLYPINQSVINLQQKISLIEQKVSGVGAIWTCLSAESQPRINRREWIKEVKKEEENSVLDYVG